MPQGSVLEPILSLLYKVIHYEFLLEVREAVDRFKISTLGIQFKAFHNNSHI